MASSTKKGSPVIRKENADGVVFFQVNRETKKGHYKILKGNQAEYCKRARLEGFDRLPAGFYKNDGYGLTTGIFLFKEIRDKYDKEIDLTLVASGTSRIDARGKKIKLTLVHDDLTSLNRELRTIKRRRNEETRSFVQGFLGKHFRQFKDFKDATPGYIPGTVASALTSDDAINSLNEDDRQHLEEFIPEYLSKISGTLRAKKKLQVVYDTLDAGRKVYLKKAIQDFKNKLKRKTKTESVWQKFLSEHILLLRSNYGEVLEKQSVSLAGKFPDFMLIDPYTYLDIYEIKTPFTRLLQYDKSRNNYYWDRELSKAISQVENYLHQVQRNSDTLINDLKESKGLAVSIVRPRGYIVAGLREQLTSTKMSSDFRILSESLKNIDLLLYDDLLDSLEAFADRLG